MTSSALAALEAAWKRTDRLFELLDQAWFARPIPLRHPFVFYLGHLPAFTWNQIGRGVLGKGSFRPAFDELFERGIDPLDESAAADVAIDDWPPLDEILDYRDGVRAALPELARELEGAARERCTDPLVENSRVLHLVLEHELMHHETLMYAIQELPPERKRAPEHGVPPNGTERAADTEAEVLAIPGGTVTLGTDFDALPFGWDNEFPERRGVRVEDFRLDRLPVSVSDFHAFVDAGGYADGRLWSAADRAWLAKTAREHPSNWRRASDGSYFQRTMFGELPLAHVLDRPAIVSHAEASAYARWKGVRLPTEAELSRAAYGTPNGRERALERAHPERVLERAHPERVLERAHPWGDEAPVPGLHGNFGFASFDPAPIGSHPAGQSAFGVLELVGNGWEWTDTDFAAHAGFEPWMRTYPGYSTDFFDGEHKVLFGAAWPTDVRLVRKSFRNWFQRRYPWVFAKFRLARDA